MCVKKCEDNINGYEQRVSILCSANLDRNGNLGGGRKVEEILEIFCPRYFSYLIELTWYSLIQC